MGHVRLRDLLGVCTAILMRTCANVAVAAVACSSLRRRRPRRRGAGWADSTSRRPLRRSVARR